MYVVGIESLVGDHVFARRIIYNNMRIAFPAMVGHANVVGALTLVVVFRRQLGTVGVKH